MKRAVRRHIGRFPQDFIFELTKKVYDSLRSQFGTLKRGRHSKYVPMVFTEQGVAVLSSVLNSDRAIKVNIAIMRAFVQLRKMIATHEELAHKLADLESHLKDHDERIRTIFQGIQQLITPPETKKKKIGSEIKEKGATYGWGRLKRKRKTS